MNPSSESYYRIGFYGAHIRGSTENDYNDKRAAERLAGVCIPDTQAESQACHLVLGVTRDGPSYLLLPYSSWLNDGWEKRYRRPNDVHRAHDYISFSPATYESREELSEKLKDYIHKPRRNQKGKGDVSRANKGVTDGRPRASFEHSRVLYHLLLNFSQLKGENPVDPITPSKLSVESSSRWKASRVAALSFTRWTKKRDGDESIWDFGWTLLDPRPDDAHMSTRDAVQIIRESWRSFNKHILDKEGIGREIIDKLKVGARVSELFEHATPEAPLVILVHDRTRTLDALREAGVDCHDWCLSLFTLLYPSRKDNPYTDLQTYRSRSRSRSPKREDGQSRRPRSPPPSSRPRIFLVDVAELYRTVTQSALDNSTSDRLVRTHASRLGLISSSEGESDKFNAGYDAELIAEMWCDMVSGLNVVDQSKMRRGDRENRRPDSPPPQPTLNLDENADEEFDPNVGETTLGPQGEGSTMVSNVMLDAFDDYEDEDE